MPRGLWWVVEIMALVAYLAIPVITFSYYSELPTTIPTHFGPSGAPNGFGDKSMLYFLLLVDTFVFVLLSMTPFFPHLINVPGPRTPENIQAAITMTRILKLEVILFMAYVTWMIVQTALGHAGGLGGIVPLLFVAVLLTTIGIGLYSSTRNAN